MLVSKAIIDGLNGAAGRYSAQQRQRLYRVGIREFFRLDAAPGPRIATLGDCGAFTYVREERPPYSVDEVIDFYEYLGFDAGLSLDHVVPGFAANAPLSDDLLPAQWLERHELTLELAAEFYSRHRARNCHFEPIGVAQGWDPTSYARAIERLQAIGYRSVALGGLVPLKSPEIMITLRAVSAVLRSDTKLHLLGVTRWDDLAAWREFGVTSFDTTSPLRQAFKDERDNYHTLERAWIALRVPQADGNTKFQRRIRAGEVDQTRARKLEKAALETVQAFDRGAATCDQALAALLDYEELVTGLRNRAEAYREVLEQQPWKSCPCSICREAGIHVMLFRGAERNRRRGFHNLYVFALRVERELVAPIEVAAAA
jgi:hypothetical protein